MKHVECESCKWNNRCPFQNDDFEYCGLWEKKKVNNG